MIPNTSRRKMTLDWTFTDRLPRGLQECGALRRQYCGGSAGSTSMRLGSEASCLGLDLVYPGYAGLIGHFRSGGLAAGECSTMALSRAR